MDCSMNNALLFPQFPPHYPKSHKPCTKKQEGRGFWYCCSCKYCCAKIIHKSRPSATDIDFGPPADISPDKVVATAHSWRIKKYWSHALNCLEVSELNSPCKSVWYKHIGDIKRIAVRCRCRLKS